MPLYNFFPLLRNTVTTIAVLLFTGVVVIINAMAGQVDYPAAFKSLTQHQNPISINHPGVSDYVRLINNLDNEQWYSRAQTLYAEDLHYSDTFMLTSKREDVLAHLADVRETQSHFSVTPYDLVEGAQGVYIVWSIENRFAILGQEINSASIGVTLFRFNEEDQIVFQQDFWDSTEGFYQHIPVLGSALRSIRNQVAGI